MSKKKVGTYYDKTIITGDINLKEDWEIHESEIGSSENGGGY